RPDLLLPRRVRRDRPVPVVGRPGLPPGGVPRQPEEVARHPPVAAPDGHGHRDQRRAAGPARPATALPRDPPQLPGPRRRIAGPGQPRLRRLPARVLQLPPHGPPRGGCRTAPPGRRVARPGAGPRRRGGAAMSTGPAPEEPTGADLLAALE